MSLIYIACGFIAGIAFQTGYPVLGNAVLEKAKAAGRWVIGIFQSKPVKDEVPPSVDKKE